MKLTDILMLTTILLPLSCGAGYIKGRVDMHYEDMQKVQKVLSVYQMNASYICANPKLVNFTGE